MLPVSDKIPDGFLSDSTRSKINEKSNWIFLFIYIQFLLTQEFDGYSFKLKKDSLEPKMKRVASPGFTRFVVGDPSIFIL